MLTRKRRHEQTVETMTKALGLEEEQEGYRKRGAYEAMPVTLIWALTDQQVFFLSLDNPDASEHAALPDALVKQLHEDTDMPSCMIDIVRQYLNLSHIEKATHDLVCVRPLPIEHLQPWYNGTNTWDAALVECGASDVCVREFFFFCLGTLLRSEDQRHVGMLHTWVSRHNRLARLIRLFASVFEDHAVWQPDTQRPAFPFASLKIEHVRWWWTTNLSLLSRGQLQSMICHDRMSFCMPYTTVREGCWSAPGLAILDCLPAPHIQDVCWGFQLDSEKHIRTSAVCDAALLRELPAVLHRAMTTCNAFQQEIAQQSCIWNSERRYHMWFRSKYSHIPGAIMPALSTRVPIMGGCLCCLEPDLRTQVIEEYELRQNKYAAE
jgi:hypothetical protein